VQNRTETPASVNSPPPAVTQERRSIFTWSSKACNNCISSRVADFYADGSGLFVEGIFGGDGSGDMATAGLSGVGAYLVVAVGLDNGGKADLIVDPKKAVSLESDSSSHMVLFVVEHPAPRIEGTEIMKKQFTVITQEQFKEGPVHLSAGESAAGYLFFPGDFEASRITVVMRLGNETFRFPFVKNPKDSARFDGTQ
jgi:hypothetical protein